MYDTLYTLWRMKKIYPYRLPDDSDWDAPEAPPEPPPMPAPSEQEANEMAVYYGQACSWCDGPTYSPQHEVCQDCAELEEAHRANELDLTFWH